MEEYGDLVSEEMRTAMKGDIAVLRRALEKGEGAATIEDLLGRLEGSAYKIAESIYSQEPGGSGEKAT